MKFNERCNFCGTCERFCPGNAIEIERELPVEFQIDFREASRDGRMKLIKLVGNCIGCGICTSMCPVGRKEILEIVDGAVAEKKNERVQRLRALRSKLSCW